MPFELDRLLIYACRVYTAPRRTLPTLLRGMRIFLGELHHTIMNPPMIVHANKPLAFSLYDFHPNGVPVEKLAAAYSLPIQPVEERIEAVRLCLLSGQAGAWTF